MPICILVANLHGKGPDERRKGGRRRNGARQLSRARIYMDVDWRHGTYSSPALAVDRPWGQLAPTFSERLLEVLEKIVIERLRGQRGYRESAAVVVQRCVDDESRAVAGLLPHADVLEAVGSVEPRP